MKKLINLEKAVLAYTLEKIISDIECNPINEPGEYASSEGLIINYGNKQLFEAAKSAFEKLKD